MSNYKRDRILVEYARAVINKYEDHMRRGDVNIQPLELELDIALTKLDLFLIKQEIEAKNGKQI